MFLKQFHIKSSTAMKGSDRKRLRQQILHQYPHISGDDLVTSLPQKGDMAIAKVITADQQHILHIYIVEKCPLWFQMEDRYYPTVYTLWKHPDLVELNFITHKVVLSKLLGGADLMLPGIVLRGDQVGSQYPFGTFRKGTLCAVRLEGNRSMIGIGTTMRDSDDMYMSGMRGKGVRMLHIYKDTLWASGPRTELPLKVEDTESSGDDREENEEEEEIGRENEDGEERNDKGDDVEESDEDELAAVSSLKLSDVVGAGREEKEQPVARTSTEDNDELLYRCFCQAIKYKVKKSELPILVSNFYRNSILSCCGPGEYIDIKKTSYKKLSKFLDAMSGKGLIRVAQVSKGVEQITDINRHHEDVERCSEPEERPPPESSSSSSSFSPAEVTSIHFINAAALPFFRTVSSQLVKGSWLSSQQVREMVTGYVRNKELNSKTEKGYIELDDVLGDLVLGKNERMTTERLKWDDVLKRCVHKMAPGYMIKLPGEEAVVKRGHLEPISFNVLQRAGNKKLTTITNLETYGINVQQFGSTLQRRVQASCSVVPVGAHRPGMMCLQCLGNQINHVYTMLTEDFNIPKKHIVGLEKGVKERKKM